MCIYIYTITPKLLELVEATSPTLPAAPPRRDKAVAKGFIRLLVDDHILWTVANSCTSW